MNNTKLSEIMTTNIVTVGPNDSMELVENIFNNNKFHHLPVVDEDEKLLGILSKIECTARSLQKIPTIYRFLVGLKSKAITAQNLGMQI